MLPVPEDLDGSDEYEVECILACRKAGRRSEYLVKWKDYSDEHNSWVPSIDMVNAQDLIREYHASKGA